MEWRQGADLRVHEIMQREVVTTTRGTSLARAAALMLEHGVNGLPVLDERGRLVGMVGIRDVLRVPLPHGSSRPIIRWDRLDEKALQLTETAVEQVMARPVVTVEPDARVIDVAALMANRGVHPIPVVAGGELVGIVGRADVARALLALAAAGRPPGEG